MQLERVDKNGKGKCCVCSRVKKLVELDVDDKPVYVCEECHNKYNVLFN